ARRRRTAPAMLTDAELTQLGRHTTATERRAQQAEREATTALLLLLMQQKLGAVFDGIVTGLLPLGVFVQIRPFMAEGLVRVADLGDEQWHFDRETNAFIGLNTRRLVHLGQPMRVQVAAVDLVRQELDLFPVEPVGRPSGAAAQPARRSRRGLRAERRAARRDR
ncbi:MAG: S1 RNA-binding domain-containing protein, partial [Planctomycetota bacterium]